MSQRIGIYVTDKQKARVKELPRGVSFSELVRDKFDIILEEYVEKKPCKTR